MSTAIFRVDCYDAYWVLRAVSARAAKAAVRQYIGQKLKWRFASEYELRKFRRYLRDELSIT